MLWAAVRQGLPATLQTYSRVVPTFTASDDDDDDDPGLAEEQRAALVRAFSTPALTLSLERVQSQLSPIAEQVNGLGRVLAAQLGPVLRASQIQTSIAADSLQLVSEHLKARRMLEPLFAQIADRQQQWVKGLVVPLATIAQVQAQLACTLVTPELTAALERINEVSRLRLEIPDADGLDRLSGLVESGDIEPSTLEAAEAGVASDVNLSAAIDEAANVLARERPWLSRERARQVVVVWVWLMWTAGLVAIAVAAPQIVGTIAGAAGLAASKDATKRAGEEFDKRFPPEDEPVAD